MLVDRPFSIYREQLSSQYQGLPLWDPNPVRGLFNDSGHVSIGDVGYLDSGAFMRIFNVKLPRDDPSNKFIEIPEGYKPLKREHFDNLRRSKARQEEYYSHVYKVNNVRAKEYRGQTYKCWAQSHGALLFLPHGARSEDVIRTKLFEDYIRDNVDSWLRWSKKAGLPVENTGDLILVTGCTLAKSWAIAAFDGTMSSNEDPPTISLLARKSDRGGAQFIWRNMRGSVAHNHRDSNIERSQDQCVFIRGFRATRGLFGIKLIRIPAGHDENPQGSRYRHPRNDELPNASSFLGDDSHFGGSGSSLDTIRPLINHKNPQLLPYPSSTGLQSNGSIRNFSFMTSPSYNPLSGVLDVAEDFPVAQPYRPLSHKKREALRQRGEGGLTISDSEGPTA